MRSLIRLLVVISCDKLVAWPTSRKLALALLMLSPNYISRLHMNTVNLSSAVILAYELIAYGASFCLVRFTLRLGRDGL